MPLPPNGGLKMNHLPRRIVHKTTLAQMFRPLPKNLLWKTNRKSLKLKILKRPQEPLLRILMVTIRLKPHHQTPNCFNALVRFSNTSAK